LPKYEHWTQQTRNDNPKAQLVAQPQRLSHHQYQGGVGFHIEVTAKLRGKAQSTRKPAVDAIEREYDDNRQGKRQIRDVSQRDSTRCDQQKPHRGNPVGNTKTTVR
jgi:hypothetical protein